MNTLIIYLSFISCLQVSNYDTIYSKVFDTNSDNYEKSLSGYKKSEFWPMWSMPIGKPRASSTLASLGNKSFSIKNISDYDLNTAWVEGGKEYGIGEYFEFIFDFPINTEYAGAYQFQGICNIFNGYCKTVDLWNANSRVKMLKVYYNNIPICFVLLKDTWHFQTFDIGKYFKNRRQNKYLNAIYEIKKGDILKFKIVDVYKGNKYKEVAISEFLCEGAGN